MKEAINSLLSIEVAQSITNQIQNSSLTGDVNGPLHFVIKNWEYYARFNAVYFLCEEPVSGNFVHFQKLFENDPHLVGMKERNGSSLSFNECGESRINIKNVKLFLSEGSVKSFIIYNWLSLLDE